MVLDIVAYFDPSQRIPDLRIASSVFSHCDVQTHDIGIVFIAVLLKFLTRVALYL